MLQTMRDKSQGLAFKVIVGLIIFVLAIFGFGAFNAFIDQNPAAADVNGREIGRKELQNETQRQKQRILSQMGDQADPAQIDDVQLQNSVLQRLINRLLFLEAADDLGLAISEQQLDKLIQANPQFQTDGKFDPALYRRLLANSGFTPLSYKQERRNSLRLVQLQGSISETALVTDWEKRYTAALLTQKRNIAYLVFHSDDWLDKVELSQNDVASYYELHKADYFTEEKVDAQYVELRKQDLLPGILVTEDEIAARYEQDKESLAGGERRHPLHILLKINKQRSEDQARAILDDVRTRVEGGESFADIAKSISEDSGSAANGGDLGFVSAKGIFVPEFERQVWSLKEGELSQPFRTEFGMHLIKMQQIIPPKIPTLAESRENLRNQIRASRAEELFQTDVRKLDTLSFEEENSLDGVANTLALPLKAVADITRKSGLGVFSDEKLRAALFAEDVLNKGYNSSVIKIDDDKAYVLRATRVSPRKQLTLQAVSADITLLLKKQAAEVEAHKAAESALDELRKGSNTTLVAQKWGLSWKRQENAGRRQQDVPAAILDLAFKLPHPAAANRSLGLAELPASSEGEATGYAVVAITNVTDGDWDAFTTTEKQRIQNELNRRAADLDYAALFETLSRNANIKRL